MHYGIYLASVDETGDPTLLAELAHEAEEEGWDGVIAIADPRQNRAILPEEVPAIRAYVQQYRITDKPFDVTIILWSEGDRSLSESVETARYSEAGVTWWLEDLSSERFSLKEARKRLHKGPPAH